MTGAIQFTHPSTHPSIDPPPAAALRVLMGQVGVLLGAAALPLALPFVVVGVGLTDTLSLAALGLSLGLSLLQTVVFAWTTRWVLSLV